jgi:hypothetical protein
MLLRLLPTLALTAGAILAADLDSSLFERLEWRNIGPAQWEDESRRSKGELETSRPQCPCPRSAGLEDAHWPDLGTQATSSSMEPKLAWPSDIPGYSIAPRLVDRLGQLPGAIDRVLAAPTPYQIEHFQELRAEFLKDIGDVNQFVERQIPESQKIQRRRPNGRQTSRNPSRRPVGQVPDLSSSLQNLKLYFLNPPSLQAATRPSPPTPGLTYRHGVCALF